MAKLAEDETKTRQQESGDFPSVLVWPEHVGASVSKVNINTDKHDRKYKLQYI